MPRGSGWGIWWCTCCSPLERVTMSRRHHVTGTPPPFLSIIFGYLFFFLFFEGLGQGGTAGGRFGVR